MNVNVNIINMWCIPITEAVTMSTLIRFTGFWNMAGNGKTHTHTQTDNRGDQSIWTFFKVRFCKQKGGSSPFKVRQESMTLWIVFSCMLSLNNSTVKPEEWWILCSWLYRLIHLCFIDKLVNTSMCGVSWWHVFQLLLCARQSANPIITKLQQQQ